MGSSVLGEGGEPQKEGSLPVDLLDSFNVIFHHLILPSSVCILIVGGDHDGLSHTTPTTTIIAAIHTGTRTWHSQVLFLVQGILKPPGHTLT